MRDILLDPKLFAMELLSDLQEGVLETFLKGMRDIFYVEDSLKKEVCKEAGGIYVLANGPHYVESYGPHNLPDPLQEKFLDIAGGLEPNYRFPTGTDRGLGRRITQVQDLLTQGLKLDLYEPLDLLAGAPNYCQKGRITNLRKANPIHLYSSAQVLS